MRPISRPGQDAQMAGGIGGSRTDPPIRHARFWPRHMARRQQRTTISGK